MTGMGTKRRIHGLLARTAIVAVTLSTLACDTDPTASEVSLLDVSEELAALSQLRANNTLRTRLQTAIESGWISAGDARRVAAHLQNTARRLRSALAAGDLVVEEAREHFIRQELKAIARSLRARVANGTSTVAEGRAAMAAYAKLLGIDPSDATTGR